jgi:translation elongation factor EF-G
MSSPSANPVKRIHVYGHASASPKSVASAFGATVSESPEADSDLAIFAINPAAGIDQQAIDNWAALDDFQIPRLVVVNGLEGQELDFDDAVMVANRVFTQLITPYLVLHGDDGEPTALIRLQDLQIIDYSKNPPALGPSDPEHEELVREFREEYLEQMSEMDEGAFAAGILFPAIPINLIKGIGVDVVQGYIDLLPSRS